MRRRMARTKKKVDPFEFPGSDDESDDDDKLSAKRKRRNSGNSTPHSVNGLDDGGGSTRRDEDGGRSTCRAKLCFPGSGNQSDTAASGTGSSEERTAASQLVACITCANFAIRTLLSTLIMSKKAMHTWIHR